MRLHICMVACCVLLAAAAPSDGDKKERSYEKRLSDEDHMTGEDDDDHNVDYDHEAFLGEEEAHEFDSLTPEESKERLGIIVDKIDKNKDGFVDEDELRNWIKYTQTKYTQDDVDKQWETHASQGANEIDWNEYKKIVYGFTEDIPEDEGDKDDDGSTSYKVMIERDKRRWDVADQNKDGKLTKEEFGHFLHPEDVDHMKDIVIDETIEDIDKNKDGKITEDEYIGDMYDKDKEDEHEPEWVENERKQFREQRDKDKNGFMDKKEVASWIIPDDYNHAEAEAKHLIYEADGDKDNKLSKAEIIEKYDLFVGSQATDFGEALVRHDEF